MDGNKKLDGLKQWRCGNGHVLGVFCYEKVEKIVDGKTVRYKTLKLNLLRQAILPESIVILTNDDVAGSVSGRMLLDLNWKCSVPECGCVKKWMPDDEALDWLRKRTENILTK